MKSNIEWEEWGKKDPLFAVATWQGKERGSPEAWTDEEFYALGKSDWSDFQPHWEHYGVKPGHCMEIGCGAGRLTKQLAGFFVQVTALDVSRDQVDYAKSRVTDARVNFVVTDGKRLPIADASCDAVFSAHVFQHFDSCESAFATFREVYRVLKPEGSIMIHLPIYHLPDMRISSLFRPMISLSAQLSDLKASMDRRQLLKGKWKPLMKRLRFSRGDLVARLQELNFTEIEFGAFAVRSNGSYHDFLYARK